ncbi:MAG: hypothetical protein KatS3mg055_3410 [Chloroflexus sp.]|jgi:hypothetical protein|nr:MAG: hypothetical protein KatS3mg055_3410 [Chloroflexus sp.]
MLAEYVDYGLRQYGLRMACGSKTVAFHSMYVERFMTSR